LGDVIDETEGLGGVLVDQGTLPRGGVPQSQQAQGRTAQGNLRGQFLEAVFLEQAGHVAGGKADDVPGLGGGLRVEHLGRDWQVGESREPAEEAQNEQWEAHVDHCAMMSS
jgi:hypothetical protein